MALHSPNSLGAALLAARSARRTLRGLVLAWVASALAFAAFAPGHAQPIETEIVRDGSTGDPGLPAEISDLDGDGVYELGEEYGDRPGGGVNLMQGLLRLNVGEGDTLLLTADLPTENVIAKVSGGEASSIFGTLASDIPGANVFLLNRSGILFGPNSSLDVQGSFYASTADTLLMEDASGARIPAFADDSRLSMAHPVAFGFLSSPLAIRAISVDGADLEVPRGEVLSLVGGELDIAGARLEAPGGSIELLAVASPGEAPLGLGDASGFTSLADLRIVSSGGVSSSIRARRVRAFARAISVVDSEITTLGGELALLGSESIEVLDRALVSSTTFDARDGGAIRLAAPLVRVSDRGLVSSTTFGEGAGGDVFVDATEVEITGGGEIASESYWTGQGGSIEVVASDRVFISGGFNDDNSGVRADVQGEGDGGSIGIDASLVRIEQGGQVTTEVFGGGRGGDIDIRATQRVEVSGVNPDDFFDNRSGVRADSEGAGAGGSIRIEAPQIELDDGAIVTAYASHFGRGSGDGGAIELFASEWIRVGDDALLTASTFGEAAGGSILLDAPLVRVEDRGSVLASSWREGAAGGITVDAGELRIASGGELVSEVRGEGDGGAIRVVASEGVSVSGSDGSGQASRIRADVLGAGKGASIEVEAPVIVAESRGEITSNVTGEGDGGEIALRATELVRVSGSGAAGLEHSSIEANTEAAGNAGSIVIEAPKIRIEEKGGLFASTSGSGAGGRISLVGAEVEIDSGGEVASDVGSSGDGGSIGISATQTVTISGGAEDDNSVVKADVHGSGRGGSIDIEAPQVRILNGGQVTTDVFAEGQGGRIAVRASERITVSGTNPDDLFDDNAEISADTEGDGHGGSIVLEAPQIEISDRGALTVNGSHFGRGSGDGGDLSLVASEEILVTERGLLTSTTSGTAQGGPITLQAPLIRIEERGVVKASTTNRGASAGAGGQITLAADEVEITNGGEVVTTSTGVGDAGDIAIRAARSVTLLRTQGAVARIQANTTYGGAAGSIEIEAPEIAVLSGGTIQAISSQTGGQGGTVSLVASDSVEIAGGSVLVNTSSDSDAGMVVIAAPEVKLADSAVLAASTVGAGRGGEIAVAAGELSLEDRAQISTGTSGSGAGGNIVLDVGALHMRERASIAARSTGTGDAGNVTIGPQAGVHATELIDMTDALIETFAEDAGGGDITIEGPGVLRMRRSAIDASDTGGEGGNVRVEMTKAIVLREGSKILARAAIAGGEGGVIEITTDAFFRSSDSEVAAENDVIINAPETNLESSLKPLTTQFLDAPALLGTRCAARGSGEPLGSFAVASRRALPAEPSPEELLVADGDAALAADSDPRAAEVRALANEGRLAIEAGDLLGGQEWVDRSFELALRESRSPAQARAQAGVQARAQAEALIHISRSQRLLAEALPAERDARLLAAHEALTRSVAVSREISDARLLSYGLGNLGSLYQEEGRPEEALHLTRQALQAANEADAVELLYRWHAQEGRLLWSMGESDEAVAAYRRSVGVLEETRQDALARGGPAARRLNRAIAPAYLQLVDALLQGVGLVDDPARSQQLLVEARATMEQLKAAELREYFRDECVADLEAQEVDLDAVSAEAAVVYPIMLEDRLELLVSLPSGLTRYTVDVARGPLTREIREFRKTLAKRTTRQYKRPARQLYDWLVRPFEARLREAGVTTLVFVPSGALYTIPMAALHDGEHFLASRYALAVTPSLSLIAPKPLEPEKASLLLAGVSESVQGYPALPLVPEELEAVHALFGGEMLLNEAFDVERIEQEMRQSPPDILHLASHASFTGDPETSFLLTHDGQLTMENLGALVARSRFSEDPLELLLLSACETASGDDLAAFGLAGVAIRSGARSALGSLWTVDDEATFEMVVEFYRQLKQEGISKAEALRAAQAKLQEGGRFAHPYYWSPFIMISNWL